MMRVTFHKHSSAGRLLKVASLVEGTTLAALVFVAVPLKHLAHVEIAVRVIGPIHGIAFLLYLWTLMQTASAGGWRVGEVVRMFVVATIPSAAFFNQPWLDQKLLTTRPPSTPL